MHFPHILRLSGSRGGIDMLNGSLLPKIITFSIPLILSGVLQQSFNSADVAVIGRYCSPQSLAAVGSNGVVIALLVNFFMGLSVGANVVIARYVGAGKREGIREAVATIMTMAILCGILLGGAGWLIARPILEMIATPADVIEPATQYLRIYFLGMPFMLLYNFGSAVLRSIGDTARPFYCLVAGGILNVAVNMLLVIGFGMDVEGVAVATVLSNILSAGLLVRILMMERGALRYDPMKPVIDRKELWAMSRIGMPAGIQGVVFPLSNVFIVSGINTFGTSGSAGSAAALNYEYYCYFVIVAFINAAVAFTSQNYGAGQLRRCDAVFRYCMAMAFVGCAALNIGIVAGKEMFTSIFTTDPDVAQYSFMRLERVLLFQSIAVSYEIAGGCMRGLGYSVIPTLITIFGTCVIRIGWVTAFHSGWYISSYQELLTVYPVTWSVTGMMLLGAYVVVRRRAYSLLPASA